jgi:two-component system CheB/CheR fusion protein
MNIIETDKNIRTKKPAHFSVVGIGASAGGLEAVTELLAYIPQQSGMAYLYIQHAPSEADSNMVEILKRVSKMPVLEASNNLEIEPDRLYVITHNAEVALEKDTIKISTRQKEQRHLPINYFFNSLAENYRERAIGILLSGNPPDGTLGLKAIKAEGGITFAQDHTAQFEGMAKNAISEAAVDLVLSPKRMGEELGKLVHHQDTYQAAIKQINEELIDDNDSSLTNILSQVHRLTGVNFSHYKLNTIKRRILRRMILQNIQSLQDYNQFLKHHTNEVNQLYQDLLINVTAFFRDRDMVNYLKKDLLPRILNIKGIAEPVRIWVPACSTGQEAYSLAILLMDVLGEKAATTSIQIFATDLSELAINKARLGIYSKDEVADIAPALLDRFFLKIDGSYRIIKSIRDLCVFASHNVIKDPPFSRLDIISCCNLLIYLEPPLQKKLMATFHYALNGTGYLILGQSETIGSSGSLFSQVDKKLKLYAKKKDAAANALFELSYRGGDQQRDPVYNGKRTSSKNKPEDLDLDKIVDQALLKKYTPACVVVNQDLDIVQFRGSTGLFLEPAPGKASLNLMKMARPGLGFELRNLVNKASKSGNMEEKPGRKQCRGKIQ